MSLEGRLVSLLRSVSNLKELDQVHSLVTKTGIGHHRHLQAKLLICYALPTWGSLERSRSIFEIYCGEDDPVLYNTMIRAYSRSLFPLEALHLYNAMCRRGIPTDHLTYPFVLRACGRAIQDGGGGVDGCVFSQKVAEVHSKIWRRGLDQDVFVQNSLMLAYSRSGVVEAARKVFDGMVYRTVASWNTLAVAYDRISDFESADLIRWRMPEKNIVSWNAAIARHVRVGNVGAARIIFEEMTERDAVSWNCMIAGHIRVKDYNSAFELFNQMLLSGMRPTEMTLVSVVGACAETGAADMGMRIDSYMKSVGLEIEGYVANALLDMYIKCGNLKSAAQVFNQLPMKHVSCWNTMIVGLAVHGSCKEALQLFDQMENEAVGDTKPNHVSFLGVLLACNYEGLVKEAQTYLSRMVSVYKIKPDAKHYGCMIDLLSKRGLLEEAYHMIRMMPAKANAVMWRSILGACRVHSNAEMAEVAFNEICKLETPNCQDCILMSNIYAERRRWEDVERVRLSMDANQMVKQMGFSQVEA